MQKSELFTGGKILICVDVVNSRYKAKGLTSYLRAMLNIDPAKTHDWYLFCNKSCTRIKILHYDHKSVWFIERELLDGSRYPQLLADAASGLVTLTRAELRLMFDQSVGRVSSGRSLPLTIA